MPVVTMKQLLEAGVHFGHQTRRWNPKMKPYIFQERNGIYILDLQRTLKLTLAAYEFIKKTVKEGGNVLFVGTKKQASDVVREEAEHCKEEIAKLLGEEENNNYDTTFYINQRWLGGLLTNFVTIRSRIEQLIRLEEEDSAGKIDLLPKKEAKARRTELQKLQKYLGGVKKMKSLPSAMFLIDLRKEHIPFLEARKLNIPVVALVDTNCDPTGVDYPIPGNDDAIRSVKLVCRVIGNGVIDGIKSKTMRAEEFGEVSITEEEQEDITDMTQMEKEIQKSLETDAFVEVEKKIRYDKSQKK